MKTYKIKTRSYFSCLNDKESLLEVTAEEIQKLIAENPEILEVKRDEKPELLTKYWFMYSDNSLCCTTWTNHKEDNYRRDTGNFFLTEEKCRTQQAINSAISCVLGYIRDNELGKEHNEDDNNYCIAEDMNKLYVTSCWNRNFLPPLGYFKSEEVCQQVINNNTADLNLIYGIK